MGDPCAVMAKVHLAQLVGADAGEGGRVGCGIVAGRKVPVTRAG